MIKIRALLLCMGMLSLAFGARAQEEDSIKVLTPVEKGVADTVKIQSYATRFVPRKASLYAAILPGMGQVYNKKYWKLPLVYGGFAAVGYGLNFYQDLYIDYKAQLFEVLETGENTKNPFATEDVLRTAINQVRRERDFMIILMAGVYILQIVDAHVDAHLKEFDVNPNLQVNLRPSFKSDALIGRVAGVSLTIKF